MAKNKIEFAGKVILDLTADTVTPETLAEGVTAHDRSGEQIVGTMSSGSGGGAKVVVPSGGTPIQGEGYVENIYFNTALSVEEVNSIIQSYIDAGGIGMSGEYTLFMDASWNMLMLVARNGAYTIFWDSDGGNCLYDSSQGGWQEEVVSQYNPLNVASENRTNTMFESSGLSALHSTELLSKLIATPPFEYKEITLSGEYDGSGIKVTDNGIIDIESMLTEKKLPLSVEVNLERAEVVVIGAKPIPDSGFIEYIYVNRGLPNSEVDTIIKNYMDNNTGANLYYQNILVTAYPIYISSSGNSYLAVADINNLGYTLFYKHSYGTEAFYNARDGWSTNHDYWFNENNAITYYALANTENYLKDMASVEGYTYNTELIKGLLSITQGFADSDINISLAGEYDGRDITVTKNTTIDINAMLAEKKLPLNVQVDVASVTGIGASSGTAIPVDGYIENIYLNTDIPAEEVSEILQEFLNTSNMWMDMTGAAPYILVDDNIGPYIVARSYTNGALRLIVNNVAVFDSVAGGWQYTNEQLTEMGLNPLNISTENKLSEITLGYGWTTAADIPNVSLLSNVISSTPFVGEITIPLEGKYDGSPITAKDSIIDIKALLDNKKLPLTIDSGVKVVIPREGTPVIGTWDGSSDPTPEQTIDGVYFNTNLSVEEVNDILSIVTYTDGYINAATGKDSNGKYRHLGL